MKKVHKFISIALFLFVAFVSCVLNMQVTELSVQLLVTFFSIVFGFYMTSITILYNASYTKSLHKQIDEKEQRRGTHILKSYLLTSGYWSIFSITAIIIFAITAMKTASGALTPVHESLNIPLLHVSINLNQVVSAGLFGIAALNIFYMVLLMNTVIDGMIEEAKS